MYEDMTYHPGKNPPLYTAVVSDASFRKQKRWFEDKHDGIYEQNWLCLIVKVFGIKSQLFVKRAKNKRLF